MNKVFRVEFYEQDGGQKVYISTAGAPGCDYKVNNIGEIGSALGKYIKKLPKEPEKHKWTIHYVPDELQDSHLVNAHTHGIYKEYNHNDLQMVIGSPEQVAFILNKFGDLIRSGLRFSDGDTVKIDIFDDCKPTSIFFKEFTECGRPVLRLILLDDNGNLPDNEECAEPYKYQYTIFPE